MAKSKVGKTVENLGDYLREQRVSAQLAAAARRADRRVQPVPEPDRARAAPASAEVLQQLAKALRVSAETLYVRAGILDPDEDGVRSVELAILADSALTERQKQSLLDVYQSFRASNQASAPVGGEEAGPGEQDPGNRTTDTSTDTPG